MSPSDKGIPELCPHAAQFHLVYAVQLTRGLSPGPDLFLRLGTPVLYCPALTSIKRLAIPHGTRSIGIQVRCLKPERDVSASPQSWGFFCAVSRAHATGGAFALLE